MPEVNNKFTTKRRFRFENAWLTDPMCRQLVWDSWESNVGGDIQDKIKLCGENLQQWGKEITGRFNARIKSCRLEMRRLRKFRDAGSVGKYKEAKKTLMLILEQKEIFWRQRSKQLWLHSGDKNSRYFHESATARRRSNQFFKLRNGEGNWVEWEDGLEKHIIEHFNHLYRASTVNWQEVVDCVDKKITADQNIELMREVTENEVKTAIFQMDPDKSPGPDGMTPAFYQKHWSIVGQDVCNLVKEFFQGGFIP